MRHLVIQMKDQILQALRHGFQYGNIGMEQFQLHNNYFSDGGAFDNDSASYH